MSLDNRGGESIFKVVVNREGQYSIWPADRENAIGWSDAGRMGTREECFAFIEQAQADLAARDAGGGGAADAGPEETGGERGDL